MPWWGHAAPEVQQIASCRSVVLPSLYHSNQQWKRSVIGPAALCNAPSPKGPINPAEVWGWSGAHKSKLVGGVLAWVRLLNWAWGYWGDILWSCKLMISGIFCLAILNLLFTNKLCLNQLAIYWFIRLLLFFIYFQVLFEWRQIMITITSAFYFNLLSRYQHSARLYLGLYEECILLWEQ